MATPEENINSRKNKLEEKTRKKLLELLKVANKNEKALSKSGVLSKNERGSLNRKGRSQLKKEGPKTTAQGEELLGDKLDSIGGALGKGALGKAENIVDAGISRVTPNFLKPGIAFLNMKNDQRKTKKILKNQRDAFIKRLKAAEKKYPGASDKLRASFARNYKGESKDIEKAFIDTLIKAENVDSAESLESLLETINGGAVDPDTLDAALKDSMDDAGVVTTAKGLGGLKFGGGGDLSPPKSDSSGGILSADEKEYVETGHIRPGGGGGGGGGSSAQLETIIEVLGFINSDVNKIAQGSPTKLDKKEDKLEGKKDSSISGKKNPLGKAVGKSGAGETGKGGSGLLGTLSNLGGMFRMLTPILLAVGKGLGVLGLAAGAAYVGFKAGTWLNSFLNDLGESFGMEKGAVDDWLINAAISGGTLGMSNIFDMVSGAFGGPSTRELIGLGAKDSVAASNRPGGATTDGGSMSKGPLADDNTKSGKIAKAVNRNAEGIFTTVFDENNPLAMALGDTEVYKKVVLLNDHKKKTGQRHVATGGIRGYHDAAILAGGGIDNLSFGTGDREGDLIMAPPSGSGPNAAAASMDVSATQGAVRDASSQSGGGGGGVAVNAPTSVSNSTTNNMSSNPGVAQKDPSLIASIYMNGTVNSSQRV